MNKMCKDLTMHIQENLKFYNARNQSALIVVDSSFSDGC